MSDSPQNGKDLTPMVSDPKDIHDDYMYARSKYYELVHKGDEAIDLMMDLARETEHPRVFEVLSNMIRQNAEIADRLMDLQKKAHDISTKNAPKGSSGDMTQNNIFVGSTVDLQRFLHGSEDTSITVDGDITTPPPNDG